MNEPNAKSASEIGRVNGPLWACKRQICKLKSR
jgi:hypothetical protein